jgi:predicted TIM-barrel fold metal-dependent hydrolase
MFPQLTIALNHHGLAWDRSESGLAQWRRGMEALAGHPNVCVKLSEFGLRGQPWDFEANARIVRETLDLFGWQRCMFASNFPVAGLRIGYAALVDALLRMLAPLGEPQQRAVMGGNALRFYRIDV